jgi:type IV pilus assembly protein PilA
MLKKGVQGFTLIEIMIVIAIVGILTTIAYPQFLSYRAKGFNSSALSDIRSLRTDLETYYAEWHQYPM